MSYLESLIEESRANVEEETKSLKNAETDFGEWARQVRGELEKRTKAAEDRISWLESIRENLDDIKAENKEDLTPKLSDEIAILRHACDEMLERAHALLGIFYDIDENIAYFSFRD